LSGQCKQKAGIAILGAGIGGCIAALELARSGQPVTLIDRAPRPMMGASRHNEGKLHLGYVYAADARLDTHKIMAQGSLRFLGILERLTGVSRDQFTVSDAFTYVVPDDSVRTPDEIGTYFDTVDDTVAQICDQIGLPRLARARVASTEFCQSAYSDRVQSAYRTAEIAVDPGRVSDIVAAAVYAHPLITFLGNQTVMDVSNTGSSGYRFGLSGNTEITQLEAAGVINALWEDRLRIDEMIGLRASSVWSQRWKATVVIDVPPGSVTIPSTTALVGPYGDFVLYGRSRVYVSWYPVCRLSMSTKAIPDEVRALAAATDHEDIRTRSLEGQSELIPGVLDLLQYKDTTRIGGGFIMAIGDSDIDDPKSALHERHQIGVEDLGNWVSLSTGKFCTAPMFAVEAAQRLKESLA